MLELVERRVLGAIEFVHAVTGARVTDPLTITCPGVTLVRNRGSLYVVTAATGFDDYTRHFDLPPTPLPASASFTLTVSDPQRRFLSRSFTLALPRASTAQSDPQSVLAPLVIPLYPAAALPALPTWAVLRARVQIAGDSAATGLVNALLTVTPQPAGLPPQIALTDADGEALIAIAGAPPLFPAAGPAFVTDFSCTVSVVLDAAVVQPATVTKAAAIPDPQLVQQRAQPAQPGVRTVAAADVSLASGHSRRTVIEVTWP